MDIYVTWITPREYTASLDDAALLSRVAGTGAEHEARQLLARLQASGTLDDPDMTRLAAVIGEFLACWPKTTSTGHLPAPPRSPTLRLRPVRGQRNDDSER